MKGTWNMMRKLLGRQGCSLTVPLAATHEALRGGGGGICIEGVPHMYVVSQDTMEVLPVPAKVTALFDTKCYMAIMGMITMLVLCNQEDRNWLCFEAV